MDQQLLGARSSDKIRDMLVKQNPITAIRQIQENKRLNDSNSNTHANCSSFFFFFFVCLLNA